VSLLLAVTIGRLTWAGLGRAFHETVRTTSMIMLIIIFASIFSHVIALLGTPRALLGLVTGLKLAPWMVFALIFGVLILIAYALEDVQYLLPVYEHLRRRLETLGRLEWVREEFARLELKHGELARDPRHRYQRIRGWENLKPRSAAVLRELVAWREGEARRRNVPRGRVIRDDVLLELARRTPTTVAALRATRGFHPSEADRNGEAVLGVIRHGLALPEAEWPEVPRVRRIEPESAGQVDLLQAVLKARAEEEEIAPSLLASASDLQALVAAKPAQRENLELPILHGWRRQLAGELLLRVLEGTVLVSITPRTGKLRLTPQT